MTKDLQLGDRLWNGAIVTEELAAAYNRASARIAAFEQAGRPVPDELLNGRHNLIAATYHGRPCRRGHPAGKRYASTRACVECVAELKRAERKRSHADVDPSRNDKR